MTEIEPFAAALEAKMRARGLSRVGAFILEALGPIAPIGAQLAYLVEPMAASQSGNWLFQLGELLEQPEAIAQMAENLRRDSG
jgi:hypothetical protein